MNRFFFGVLDERPSERPERIRRIDLYENIPYFNGGLFRPIETGERGIDDRDFDVRDSILGSIINLLERNSFSADGGPTDLDPSILGNVFEKTINHITSDAGDQKKELGAYYTPDEITRFCAKETVRPALRERFGEVMIEECNWTEAMADYDDVYDLIEAIPNSNIDVIKSLLAEIEGFRALDPACGSGHFLTSVQEEIVGIRKALYEGLEEDPDEWKLQKQTIIENIYGVDIVEPAVEITKLRLWLSIIAEVDPEEIDAYDEGELALPNVVFNVRQGNSLIGYTELMETGDDSDQARLSAWGPDSVRQKYGNIIAKVSKHKHATTTEEAQRYLQEAENLLEEYRVDLNEKVLNDFHEAGVKDMNLERIRKRDPFHWVLEFAEVYADGGFDILVGNPPWDVLTPTRDDYFSKFDEVFRNRMPDEKDKKQKELLNNTNIKKGWEEYKSGVQSEADYFNNCSDYVLQSPKVAGKTVGNNQNDLSSLFLERCFTLNNPNGRTSLILPRVIFNGSTQKDLRMYLLNNTELNSIVGFENKGIFDSIDDRFNFGIVTYKNKGRTEELKGIFQKHDVDILRDIQNHLAEMPRGVLEEYSPEARLFPQVRSQAEVNTLKKILQHPSVSKRFEDTWYINPYAEIHKSKNSERLFESKQDYPIYGGRNIYQYSYNNNYIDLEPVKFWSVEEDQPKKVPSDVFEKRTSPN